MEDRVEPGLYLEMVDGAIEPYLESRLPLVRARTGVVRATWWANVCRDRTDLPRRLPELDHLVLYEVDDGFAPPPPAPAIPAHHYRRTPRPGQGRLSAAPTIGLSLVLISPRAPEQAQALRDWGDFVHIHHIAAVGVPGYTMITPYEHADGGDPRFLHLYEMDTDDPESSFQAMTPLVEARLGGGPGTPAFDRWATTPELRIMYVNTFRRLGEEDARR